MLRSQDGLGGYGTGSGSRAKMLATENIWLAVGADVVVSQANPRISGGYHLRYTGSGTGTVDLSLAGSLQTFGHGFAFSIASLPSSKTDFLQYRYSSGAQAVLAINPDGSLETRNGSGTVLDTSAAGVVTISNYVHFEARAHIAGGTSGTYAARINKATKINLTGHNFKLAGGPDDAMLIRLLPTSTSVFGNVDFADFFVWDTTGGELDNFIGNKVCWPVTVVSTGTSPTTDWDIEGSSPAGTVHGSINEASPDNDVTCIEATAAGQASRVGLSCSSDVTGAVALTFHSRQRLTSAGTSKTRLTLESGASEEAGTERIPAYPTYTGYMDTFTVNPDGDVPLDPTDINAMELLIERTV